jgi:O-antigen/teichoic acid export membrane protein
MLNKIAQTFTASVGIALFTFITTALAAKFLGASGVADIGIFLFKLSLIAILTAVFGSTAIVYILPKNTYRNIFVVTNLWAITAPFLAVTIFYLIDPQYPHLKWLLLVSIVQSIYINLLSVSLALKKIKQYNIVRLTQSFLLTALFLIFYSFTSQLYSEYYFIALFISLVLPLIYLLFNQFSLFSDNDDQIQIRAVVKSFFSFGGLSQLTNLLQSLNYRICYLFIALFCQKEDIGLMVLALTVVDGIWMLKNSVSLLNYVETANQNQQNLVKLMRISFFFTCVITIIVLLIPNQLYVLTFGKDFNRVKDLLLLMSPAILVMSATSIIANYFSGLGKVHINFFVTTVSLAVFLPAGYLLTKYKGLPGAAIANNIPLLLASVILFVVYSRYRESSLRGESAKQSNLKG